MADANGPVRPTPEELAEAEARLRLEAQFKAADERAKVQPVLDLATSPEFLTIAQALATLDPGSAADRRIRPFLHAMETGMEGVANFAAQFPVPIAAAPPAE